MNIIITGASKGIGFAIAKAFALQQEAHAIGICSRDKDSIAKAEAELRSLSSTQKYFSRVCDVSQEKAVHAFVAEFAQQFGPADVLVNNAGFGMFRTVLDLTKQEFDSVLGTNLRGVFLCTRAVLPDMRRRKSGTIITIGSLAGKNGFKGGAAYCASKFAVRGLMQCLFLEVRTDNIRFVTINPGSVRTEFFDSAGQMSDTKTERMLLADDVAECVLSAVRLPLSADLSDIDLRPTNPKG